MAIDKKNRDEKLQYNINRETAKISVLSPGKIDNYEYLIGEKILSFGPNQIIQHAKFTILLWKNHLKNKQKQLGIKEINK